MADDISSKCEKKTETYIHIFSHVKGKISLSVSLFPFSPIAVDEGTPVVTGSWR